MGGENTLIEESFPTDPVVWLSQEFLRRREKNAAYSLRSFARSLSISSGALSQILARKRPLSAKSAKKICERLGYSPDVTVRFLEMTQREFCRSLAPQKVRQLDLDVFRLIADWYHYAILSLLETKGASSTPQWIARRLCITPVEARGALERLLRLGLLRKEGNHLKPQQTTLTTPHDKPSGALRKLHRQSLERAIASLEEVPVELREISLVTMAISPKKLPIAKEMIRRFRRSLTRLLEDGERTEVYNLTIQLVPVTKGEST